MGWAPWRTGQATSVSSARRLHEPESIEQLQEIVRSASKVRVLGSRHSFNTIADTTGDLVSLERLPRRFDLDVAASTLTVDGAVRYGELCARLDAAGWALHNLASLPHISVAGACATGTHGSGDRSGNLATAVSRLEVVGADGEITTFRRDGADDGFAGAVVSLGALGVVVGVALDVQPSYGMRQDLYEDLPLAAAVEHFDEITRAADSVSLFTEWRGPTFEEVWLKRRVTHDVIDERPPTFFGARPATSELHPIRRLSAEACTPQLGVVGPWHERLPHFRMDHTPSSGKELQTEYILPRRHAADAILAVNAIRDRIAPLLQVSEIRTIAADDLWLSPSYRQPSVAIHFTWIPDWPSVRPLLPIIEAALDPFEPRPHWGKLFAMSGEVIRGRYPRLGGFVALAQRHDPEGRFRNAFLERNVFGGARQVSPGPPEAR